MMIFIKVFPIVGVCDQSQELEIPFENSKMSEVLTHLEKRVGFKLADKYEKLMLLHNGQVLDIDVLKRSQEVVFEDGDKLWLLPLLSGG